MRLSEGLLVIKSDGIKQKVRTVEIPVKNPNGLMVRWFYVFFCFCLLVLSAILNMAQAANPWTKVNAPTKGQPEAIGATNAGCVSGALALPMDGPGYRVMRPSRNRYYGHPDLVRFIQTLGRQIEGRGIGTLLVGDLSQPRGGPMSSMHRSHQSGLDVDLWFQLPHGIDERSLSKYEREQWQAPSMLTSDGVSLHPQNWTIDQAEMLRLVAQHPEVDRVFVNPVIKREMCRTQSGGQWLHKLRPWWGHDDHLHVRLRCPPGEIQCESQGSLPAGDGCDESLAWWFSEEAKQKSAKPSEPPELPKACLALINQK